MFYPKAKLAKSLSKDSTIFQQNLRSKRRISFEHNLMSS